MRLFKGKFHHWVLFLVIQPYSFATPGNRYRLLTVDDNGEMLMDAERPSTSPGARFTSPSLTSPTYAGERNTSAGRSVYSFFTKAIKPFVPKAKPPPVSLKGRPPASSFRSW